MSPLYRRLAEVCNVEPAPFYLQPEGVNIFYPDGFVQNIPFDQFRQDWALVEGEKRIDFSKKQIKNKRKTRKKK